MPRARLFARIIFATPALGLLFGLLAAAQQPSLSAFNTIHVVATGEFQAEPDTAVAQFEITGANPNLKAAYAQAQSQAEEVRALLQKQGFTPQQAHWSGYTVQPNHDYKTRRVTDYTVTTSLSLELADFQKIGPLVDAFGAAGINALRGVSFELKKMDAAKASAIADGYRQTQLQAAALAHAAGRQIKGLISASIDVSSSSYPIGPRVFAMAAAVAAPAPTEQFTPHTITVSARIDAVYGMNQ